MLAFEAILKERGLNKAFFPFKSSANSSLLYLIARCFREFNIKSVLEMGVGQTTFLLDELRKNMEFEIVSLEHDPSWRTDIQQRVQHPIALAPLVSDQFDNIEFSFYDCKDELKSKKFDLIIVDGPPGIGQRWPRFGIVPIVRQNLASDFVIIVDDAERRGERRTCSRLKKELKAQSILHHTNLVRAAKTQFVVASTTRVSASHF